MDKDIYLPVSQKRILRLLSPSCAFYSSLIIDPPNSFGLPLLLRRSRVDIRVGFGHGTSNDRMSPSLMNNEAARDTGITCSLSCLLTHREFPYSVLFCASPGQGTDAGFKPGGICFAGLKQHGVRKQAPDRVANLVDPG